MENRVKWIDHKGKKILFVDYSNTTTDESLQIIKESRDVAMTQEKDSVLMLIDVTNNDYNKESWQAMREAASDTAPYTKAFAITGLEGVKRFFLKVAKIVTKGNLNEFSSADEAKDWLVTIK